MNSHIKLLTVQGIGDIFWAYQKVAPHVDTMDIRIAIVHDNPLQKRAGEFAKLLPKVQSVEFQEMPLEEYNYIAAWKRPLREVLAGSDKSFHPYSVNKYLEEGIHITAIDPSPHNIIEGYVRLRGKHIFDTTERYICMFVAGGNNKTWMWPAEAWTDVAVKLCTAHNIHKIKLIGAEWDMPMSQTICDILRWNRIEVDNLVGGTTIEEVIHEIRNAEFFFGYQSGLNVIAHNYNVPQFMVYFPHLRNLMYSWITPLSANLTYHAVTMDMPTAQFTEVLASCIKEVHARRSTGLID